MNAQQIHLTSEELTAITGRVRWSAQLRWLRMNGFTVLRRADGMPLVSRAHFEAVMGGSDLPNGGKTDVEPDYDSL